MALHHGQVFSKEQIYESVFGVFGESDNSVIVEHVKNIRGKFALSKEEPIKTPLTIIKGNVELLGETVLDQEQMLYQKYIIENATQIEGYINKLVELSKSETPEALAVKKVAVKNLLDGIHEQTSGMIIKKNIKLTWQEMDLASVTIQADREKLHRAIMNVMGNAVEFMPPQGTIAVAAQKGIGN